MRKRLIRWLVDKKCIAEEDIELYEYAVDSLLFMCAPFAFIAILGIVMGDIVSSVIIVTVFLTIRRCAGGFHAGSPLVCFISSTCILGASYFVPDIIHSSVHLIVCTAVAAVIIFVMSPVEHANKPLSAYEKKHNKIKTVVITSIWLCIESVLYITGLDRYCVNVATGIFLILIMQLLCVPQLLKTKIKK